MSTESQQAPSSQSVSLVSLLPVALFVFALIVRLIYLAEDSANPFFAFRFVDAEEYDSLARGFVEGLWPAPEAYFRPPLYPLLLGVLYKWVSSDIAVVKTAQAIVGSGTVVLTYYLGMVAFRSRRVAAGAGMLVALCGPLIYFDGQPLSASLDVFLFAAAVVVASRAARSFDLRWWAATGLAVGVGATCRGAMVLMIPVLAVWIVAVSGPASWRARRRVAAVAVLIGASLVPIAPMAWHNARYDPVPTTQFTVETTRVDRTRTTVADGLERLLTGDYAPFGFAGGVNLYLGNVPRVEQANEEGDPRHFTVFSELNRWPYDEGVIGAAAHSRFLRDRTLEAISERPDAWLALEGRKALQLVNGVEIPRGGSIYADRVSSTVLSMLLWHHGLAFPMGLIIPLALLGMVLSADRWRDHGVLIVAIGCHAAFLMVFFVTARYRLPMIPVLAVYAAYGVVQLVHLMRGSGLTRRGVGALAVGVGALVVSNLPIVASSDTYSAVEHFNLAAALERDDGGESALAHYREAVNLRPGTALYQVGLSDALARRGRPAEALEPLKRASALSPDDLELRTRVGTTLLNLGRYREAATVFEQALGSDAGSPGLLAYLGAAIERLGELERAETLYVRALAINSHTPVAATGRCRLATAAERPDALPICLRAVRLDPNAEEPHLELAQVLRRLGRPREAARELAVGSNNRGARLLSAGRLDEAQAVFERARGAEPSLPLTYINLGAVAERKGHPDRADAAYKHALELDVDNSAALVGRCRVAMGRGQLTAAEALCRRAVEVTPDNPMANMGLATVLEAHDRPDEARQYRARARELVTPDGASGLPAQKTTEKVFDANR